MYSEAIGKRSSYNVVSGNNGENFAHIKKAHVDEASRYVESRPPNTVLPQDYFRVQRPSMLACGGYESNCAGRPANCFWRCALDYFYCYQMTENLMQ